MDDDKKVKPLTPAAPQFFYTGAHDLGGPEPLILTQMRDLESQLAAARERVEEYKREVERRDELLAGADADLVEARRELAHAKQYSTTDWVIHEADKRRAVEADLNAARARVAELEEVLRLVRGDGTIGHEGFLRPGATSPIASGPSLLDRIDAALAAGPKGLSEGSTVQGSDKPGTNSEAMKPLPLTPYGNLLRQDEVRMVHDAAYAHAIEEAAKVADQYAANPQAGAWNEVLWGLAAAIRALGAKP